MVSNGKVRAALLAALMLVWPHASRAEVTLGEFGGWTATSDGRVNAFVSHVWGDNRPEGLGSLSWVAFNESTAMSQADADGKLSKTKIRSGYVPSTIAFNFRNPLSENFKVASRVEIGIQITSIEPSAIADPTWMDPRSVYLDLSGNWGSLRAGRDFSLFPRGNLLMNAEIGHAYGVGFPCAYEKMYGGACGHVGFGTLFPDFRAQLTYTTPSIADIVNVSIGVFDPRAIPTYEWFHTPLPRVEGEAVANYSWKENWGVKAWANGFHQRIGTAADIDPDDDPSTMNSERKDFTQDAYGVGGGLQTNLGPVKAGFAGYTGQGMDGFVIFSFNPIYIGQGQGLANHERKFRTTRGFLGQASLKLGDTWIMGGFGQTLFDRMDTDRPIDEVDAFPLIRKHTGISAGVFHRVEYVVFGLDYFNAHYSFDPRRVTDPAAPGGTKYVEVAQTVHTVSAGVTLEW